MGGGPGTSFFVGLPQAQSVEIYNIAGNSWTYGNPVVTKAAAPSGGLAGGKLMVQGGVDNITYYNLVQVSTLGSGGGTCPSPTPSATATPSATRLHQLLQPNSDPVDADATAGDTKSDNDTWDDT